MTSIRSVTLQAADPAPGFRGFTLPPTVSQPGGDGGAFTDPDGFAWEPSVV